MNKIAELSEVETVKEIDMDPLLKVENPNDPCSTQSLSINNTTENIIRGGKEQYHLLERGFSDIKQIGIIGWGSQAPSQVQNLNDTLRSINSDIKIYINKIILRYNTR